MRSLMIGLLLLAASGCSDAIRINGGGASFVYPAMLKWTRLYAKEFQTEIDYTSAGSGNGVSQMLARTIQFGCTDAFIKNDQLDKFRESGREILHIPLVMGGVVPIYNVPEAKQPLRFTGDVLARIYLGEIESWNHPDLQRLNPEVALPDRKIAVAFRSDSSGTTAIFTEFLSKSNATWGDKENGPGAGTTIKWRRGVGQRDNSGVAGYVGRSEYALGYAELMYARQNNLTYGAVEIADSVKANAAERKKSKNDLPLNQRIFLQANLDTVSAAADAKLSTILQTNPDLRYSLINSPGANSYPIVGTNWCVFFTDQPRQSGEAMIAFLKWATTFDGPGQRAAQELGYAPLPRSLCELIQKRLSEQVKWID
ncbi:phosphate ABC transporter substrate-binding protein PstS [Tuwongella immobilis]|nr:phosphate ABC transporter substrate-binding protein PstS [Tuwongella immobilis]